MAIFSNRGATAVDDREQALNDEISRLEKEIAELKTRPAKAQRARPVPSVQTAQLSDIATPEPEGTPPLVTNVVPVVTVETPVPPVPLPPSPPPSLPTVAVGVPRAKIAALPSANPGLSDPRYNELGERKFDLGSWWQGVRHQFRRTPVGSNNPEMVKYLAAGSVQGLRPLRFERRIARNRTVGLVSVLVVVLYGLAWVFFRH